MKVTPENISRIAKSLFRQENLTAEQLEAATKEISSGFDDAGVFSAAKMNKEQISKTTPELYAGRPMNDVDMTNRDSYDFIPDIGDRTAQDISQLNGPNWHSYQKNANSGKSTMSFTNHDDMTNKYEAAKKNTYSQEQLAKNSTDPSLYQASKEELVDANPFLHTDQGKQALDYLFNTNAGKEYSDQALNNLAEGYKRTGEYGLGMMSLPTKSSGLMGMMGSNEFGAAIGGGIIGGAVNSAMGGDFESGFMAGGLAGGIGKSITKNIAGSASDMMRLEKSAIGKVLDENKSYDEILESRRAAYEGGVDSEIKALEEAINQNKNSLDEAQKKSPILASNLDSASTDPSTGKKYNFAAERRGIYDNIQNQEKNAGLNPGESRPQILNEDDFKKQKQNEIDNQYGGSIDFNGKKVNVNLNDSDELARQHMDEISKYQRQYEDEISNAATVLPGPVSPSEAITQLPGPVKPQIEPTSDNLFKDYDEYKQFAQDKGNLSTQGLLQVRRSQLSENYNKVIEPYTDAHVNLLNNSQSIYKDYSEQTAKLQGEWDKIHRGANPYDDVNRREYAVKTAMKEQEDNNLMIKNANTAITESDTKIKGLNENKSKMTDDMLHKEMLKEASQKELGSEAGFFQKRAQNMIKPGTRDSGKSTGIESRHMVLGGSALAGGIFGNRKRDHSRGFNSHRGSRI